MEWNNGRHESPSGVWAVVSHRHLGKTLHEETEPLTPPALSFVLHGESYTQKRGERVMNAGHFSINPTVEPKQFDVIFDRDHGSRQVIPGIYCFEEDLLLICLGDERPDEFVAPPQKSQALWVCRRVGAVIQPTRSSANEANS
ncbi:MAG: TIGR03067 domain-containing protein [Planctomycetes bacterium]|nr:TIGR03067 domain-containing protein [Planctomycetota bacterium]